MEKRTALLGLALLSCVVTCSAKMSSSTKTEVAVGITALQDAVEGIGNMVSSEKLTKSIEKLSGFLGVAGGLISLILVFLPEQDSAELTYMKEKFAEVNSKLDQILNEFDNVKDLITLETQRAAYIADAAKIDYGHKELPKFTKLISSVKCKTKRDCIRQRMKIGETFLDTFNVKASIAKILTGSISSTSVFGDPLLEIIKKTYKCDVTKLDKFANGVLKIAFRGQEVALVYEKLTGSNESIVILMKDWSNMVYALRAKLDSLKKDCYDNIKTYINADVEDTNYQRNMASNKIAADTMAKTLAKKYPWVHWTVISYGGWDAKRTAGEGTFNNIPSSKEDRKRVVVATPQDKGTYDKQRLHFSQAIDKIVAKNRYPLNAKNTYDAFVLQLKRMDIWKTLSSFMMLRLHTDLQTSVDETRAKEWFKEWKELNSVEKIIYKIPYQIIATFYSSEEIKGVSCSKTCSGKGTCAVLPFSSTSYCICKPYYQGENCEEHDKIDLASSVDTMLAITSTIPKLTDVYYELQDMQDYIGSSLNNVQNSIAALDMKLETKLNDLDKQISREFQWAKLTVHYSETLRNLKYYLHRFQKLKTTNPSYAKDSVTLAKDITQPSKIRKWMFELHKLIVGRDEVSVLVHKPLLFLMMDTHKAKACENRYKVLLDNSWRQIMVLQNIAYIMWAQAKSILNEPTAEVLKLFKEKTKIQTTFIETKTCELDVAKSVNLHCSGGFYLYPTIKVVNKCEKNYFIVGETTTSCASKSSKCEPCNCNAKGSNGLECQDLTGQCACTNGYYGKKCSNRNCKWTSFGSYGSCSRSCNYGGTQKRTRSHGVTQKGSGKSCTGASSQTRRCFHRCCSGYSHCSRSKKCIPKSQICDYDKDCSYNEDERSCKINCVTHYTSFSTYGNEGPHYLDRHKVDCGRDLRAVLSMFRLQKAYHNIRYKFICCNLKTKISTYRQEVVNRYTSDGGNNMHYLDRQHVNCGTNGILAGFRLHRDGAGTHLRYKYPCLRLNNKYQKKKTCYTSNTPYTYDGGRRNYYLDRLEVGCKYAYYLAEFRLQRRGDHWGYKYRCCHIRTT